MNREKLYSIVEVFYQSNFKTFYVNSLDGENFIKPVGIFVSLGITTSMDVINSVCESIQASGSEFKTRVVEISSKKVLGRYLNTVTDNIPQQYILTEFPEGALDKKAAQEELKRLKALLDPSQDLKTIQETTLKVQKLNELISRFSDDTWDNHVIVPSDNDYKLFHKKVNYKSEGEGDNMVEYRIGILVVDSE